MREASETRRVGFTLIELLVVIAVIGLLISLILVAAADGVRRAEERATQALITKLETALNDRLDALLNTQPPVNQTHRYLAAINTKIGGSYVPVGSTSSNSDDRRAQVIAQFDFIKSELPDVFFLNSQTLDGASFSTAYPLNFAAAPYPAGGTGIANYVLPLGNNFPGLPFSSSTGTVAITSNPDGTPQLGVTGIFGASFSAAGGVYKNLYTAASADLLAKAVNSGCTVNITPGFDGVDNNGDGLIDELISPTASKAEVVVTGSPDQPFSSYVAARLANHKHKTARAEMLYALLVEGLSPLGSAFGRDDFTAKEVQDTDNDGLPEFVDAWGEPLQFFRWPIYYGGSYSNGLILGTSDSQLGCSSYGGPSQVREQDPLDPNQLLVSPAWWAASANASLTTQAAFTASFTPPNGTTNAYSSPGAIAFMNYFHSLVDPQPTSTGGTVWDRGSNFTRRAYFSKFLILSGGPDREPGVAQFAKDYSALIDPWATKLPSTPSPYLYTFPDATLSTEQNALRLIYIENQAAVSDPIARSGSFWETPDGGASGQTATVYLYGSANSDDITNHNISGISTGVR